tara:strand:+ start:572 stop:1738 length:1167 start_codon:yes stop_codon:yes gene_type:complete
LQFQLEVKKDFVDQSKVKFYQNPIDLVTNENADIIVELIGGNDVAYELSKKALMNKKCLVTANKAMIATNGLELVKIAEQNKVSLFFEAAVAGAIPILKIIREGLAANEVKKIYAILNGTCNYILTKMAKDKTDFAPILKQAQNLGYAESNPITDIEGTDTAHKLAIIIAIVNNSIPKFSDIYTEGITKINIDDIVFAREFGYDIKLLAVYENHINNIAQYVYPCLVKTGKNIANITDSYNAILTHCDNAGWNMSVGKGAGMRPTASAVVADLIDIANNRKSYAFGANINHLQQNKNLSISQRIGGYYIRFIIDKIFAQTNDIPKLIFKDANLDIEILMEDNEKNIKYAIKIAHAKETDIKSYIENIAQINQISSVNMMRIEDIKSDI